MRQSQSSDFDVLLRPLETKDAEFLMELNNDSETAKYVVGDPKPVTPQQQLEWMERVKGEKNTKRFAVEYAGQSVGTVIISDIDMNNLTANLNIKLLGWSRGRGIGKQSICKALKICFDRLGLYCITAHILPYNIASLTLFSHSGFTREGVLRSRVIKAGQRYDLISFSITKDDYKNLVTRSI